VAVTRPEAVGVLIVRVWLEGSPELRLRARITRTLDVTSEAEEVTTTSSVEEVQATVRRWLDDFVLRRTVGCGNRGGGDARKR